MFRITLNNTIKGQLILDNPPVDWENIELELNRSDMYWAVNRKITAPLIWVLESKIYIDNIVREQGLDALITCKIEVINPDDRVFNTLLDGKLGLDSYKKREYETEAQVIDGSFEEIIYNKSKIKVKYNTRENIDGSITTLTESDIVNVIIKLPNGDNLRPAVTVYNLVNRIVEILTGEKYRFKSSLFGKDSVSTGIWHYLMATYGRWLRQYPENENELTTSLQDVFQSLDSVLSLGMAVVEENGERVLRVERKKFFFDPTVILELGEVTDLEISPIESLQYSEIEVGYDKFNTMPIELGQVEYNCKNTYTTPLKSFDKKLDLTSKYRADGSGILNLINATNLEKNSPEDKDIFLLDCYENEEGYIVTKGVENLYSYSGIQNDQPLYVNMEISPARNLIRWGEVIRSGLGKYENKNLKIQVLDSASKLATRKLDSVDIIRDGSDISIFSLEEPFLSGFKANFNYPLELSLFLTLNRNFHGLISYLHNGTKMYGWLKKGSTSPIDTNFNWELWLKSTNIETSDNLILSLREDLGFELREDGGYCLQETY